MTSVTVNHDALRRRVSEALNEELQLRAVDLERCLRANAPRDTGRTAESITVDVSLVDGDLHGSIKVGGAAEFVLRGFRAGSTFVGPNDEWMRECVDQHLGRLTGRI